MRGIVRSDVNNMNYNLNESETDHDTIEMIQLRKVVNLSPVSTRLGERGIHLYKNANVQKENVDDGGHDKKQRFETLSNSEDTDAPLYEIIRNVSIVPLPV